MDHRVVNRAGQTCVELTSGAFLACEGDAVEITGLCNGVGANFLMLRDGNLSSDFFDLKTGLAGAALLKWSNCHIRAAAVVSLEWIGAGRFHEFALEINRGRQFYLNEDIESAEKRLHKLDIL